jgi:uncharacterized membrane protein
MIPRSELVQGATAGLAFALGYGIGVGLRQLAAVLQWLPERRAERVSFLLAALLAAAIIGFGLIRAPEWQNDVRGVMGLPPLDGFSRMLAGVVALGVTLLLIALGRAFRLAWHIASKTLRLIVPTPTATVLGLFVAIAGTWALTSGVVVRQAVATLDAIYARMDALIPPDGVPPADAVKSGSAASLISWTSLGAEGRRHVRAAPDRRAIEELTGAPAREPIRVYVGLNAAPTPKARAEMALAELKRTGAFERANLVISTPTGTGWVDPAASTPMEYLLRGDVASVSVQYSYLPSWLSLLVEPESGAETARHVFRLIHAHWSSLPAATRPKLYLFGLSLGSLNSDLAVDLHDILAAPHQGALWVGPPFRSRTWRSVVSARNDGTSVWQPRYSDGRMFRFATQHAALNEGYAPWGPLRVIYVQYPSDPIVFFETDGAWRRPAIFDAPRPPDVAPGFTWTPVISFVQMVVDMMIATSTPRGFGHVYAAEHYLEGWLALTEPQGWTPDKLEALRKRLRDAGL